MAKNPKWLRIMIMKCVKVFLILLFFSGCKQPEEEEEVDLDLMVMDERDQHASCEPLVENPQEQLVRESKLALKLQ